MKTLLTGAGCRVYESALFRTTTTLITGDDHLLLADPTWLPDEIERIAGDIEPHAAGRTRYLLFTHSDYDHIIGCGRFAGWHTLASAAFVRNANPEEPLQQIRDFDDAYYITRDYPISYPRIDTPLEGPEVNLDLGGEAYRFYPAPGHNPDGVITLNRTRGILIAGDYLSNVEFPYVYHSVAAYRATLHRFARILEEEDVRLLVSGHGDPTTDRAEMQVRIRDAHAYLDELEDAVRRDVPFDLDRLFRRYRFPKVMRTFHAGNVDLMRRHLAEVTS